MYLAILILPLLGSIVSGFFGRKTGISGAQIITCTAIVTTTSLAALTFFEVGYNNILTSIELFRWIDSEALSVKWAFCFDSLTASMLIPVLIVSSLVHIYSIGYMSNDPHIQRFFSYLSLFTFMMLILLSGDNFLVMFVGWEGVGVCSYLLVCFWFNRIAANQSSLSAFLTNRVGDCFLTVGMFIMFWGFGNLDYTTIFSLAPYTHEKIITIGGVCLVIGAMAKSSQVGLHMWLPMAMEGPTPVSALIHAATMVTAGVYLLMRSSPFIEYSLLVLGLCLFLGTVTTVFSSLIGLFQQDIKKVIAYSTMSQLGMMVIAVGLSSYGIALFHLVNHAFYKALLFLGAGGVIHGVGDNQDFRKYGGLRQFLPLTYSVMLVASLSLVAFPYMTGFYSKDLILESTYGRLIFSTTVVYIIATIGAMFTTLYSVKVLYLTFLTNPNGPLINYKKAHEGNIFMSLPLMILGVFSIYFGFITKDMFIGLGSGFFSDNALFIHPSHEIMLDTEFGVPTIFKLLPLLFTISLTIIATVLSEYLPSLLIYFKLSRIGYNIFSFFNQRFLIELFSNKYITGTVLNLGGQTTKVVDKGSVEYLGPHGLEKGLLNISNNIANLNTKVIPSYALYILLALISYLLCNIYINNNTVILILILGLSLVFIERIPICREISYMLPPYMIIIIILLFFEREDSNTRKKTDIVSKTVIKIKDWAFNLKIKCVGAAVNSLFKKIWGIPVISLYQGIISFTIVIFTVWWELPTFECSGPSVDTWVKALQNNPSVRKIIIHDPDNPEPMVVRNIARYRSDAPREPLYDEDRSLLEQTYSRTERWINLLESDLINYVVDMEFHRFEVGTRVQLSNTLLDKFAEYRSEIDKDFSIFNKYKAFRDNDPRWKK